RPLLVCAADAKRPARANASVPAQMPPITPPRPFTLVSSSPMSGASSPTQLSEPITATASRSPLAAASNGRSAAIRNPLADLTVPPSGVSGTALAPNHSTAEAESRPYSQSATPGMNTKPMVLIPGMRAFPHPVRRVCYVGDAASIVQSKYFIDIHQPQSGRRENGCLAIRCPPGYAGAGCRAGAGYGSPCPSSGCGRYRHACSLQNLAWLPPLVQARALSRSAPDSSLLATSRRSLRASEESYLSGHTSIRAGTATRKTSRESGSS